MEAKIFFRKVENLIYTLNRDLDLNSESKKDTIAKAEYALVIIDACILKLKELLSTYDFTCIADEIAFFKDLKPKVISQFIYYSQTLHIESSKPKGGHKTLLKYYSNELLKLRYFYNEHKEFYNYYRRKATYLDTKYFLRNNFDLKMRLSSHHYNFDQNFTTPYDNILATIIANDLLELDLHIAITKAGKFDVFENKSSLSWTGSKSSLVELVFALHHSKCINSGNIELVELMSAFSQLFNINVGNFYKTITEIKNRKTGRNKFLQNLNDSLNQLFLDDM